MFSLFLEKISTNLTKKEERWLELAMMMATVSNSTPTTHSVAKAGIARTFQKLDPNNASAKGLIEQLLDVRKQIGANQQMQRTTEQAQNKLIQLDGAYRANPANAQVGLQYAAALAQSRRTNDAVAVLDTLAQTGNFDPPKARIRADSL